MFRTALTAATLCALLGGLLWEPTGAAAATTSLRGLDVSGYQGNVDWPAVAAGGASFAYIKATESTGHVNGYFGQQYNGAASAGLIRGAYHFAHPDASSGSAQADFFVDHGGGWTADGRTLPGALDIEYNPGSGGTCYGLGRTAMIGWIASFTARYRSRTGRSPVIYTTTDWWNTCTGNTDTFAVDDPLWIARPAASPLSLPNGWSTYTFWQNHGAGTFPGDQDVFNGGPADLRAFALGDYTPPPPPPSWPYVQQNQTGRVVTTVQYLLNEHGTSLAVDGVFGAGTRAVVVAFQSAAGLTADGVVGPDTWQRLVVTVRQGGTGPAVRAAQAELAAHGATLAVDGVFGPATAAAVAAFQSGRGLPADGVVDAATWQALVS
ncbi:GH25 family lysozyme [Dactylosporangium sp. NPDC049140]|uniref:GH25 family lysozyme n=1 Tax=Dactylosporangium sp. NPDC049140 TaxID=3155647 RepID=UPI0033DCF76D